MSIAKAQNKHIFYDEEEMKLVEGKRGVKRESLCVRVLRLSRRTYLLIQITMIKIGHVYVRVLCPRTDIC